MTAQQLAQRCAEIGLPIHRTTITKIENGRPRVDVGELVVLAEALRTAPLVLLYPGPYPDLHDDSREYRIAMAPGGQFVPPQVAAEWFAGRMRGVFWESYVRHAEPLLAAMRRSANSGGLREIREQVDKLSEAVDKAIDNAGGRDA